eukprot:2109038-Karenia_brevis.AAC.1
MVGCVMPCMPWNQHPRGRNLCIWLVLAPAPPQGLHVDVCACWVACTLEGHATGCCVRHQAT